MEWTEEGALGRAAALGELGLKPREMRWGKERG